MKLFKNFLFFILISSLSFGQSTIISEKILVKNDSIELPGTLTYSNQNSPLIIWIHGSGNVDRNGNQKGVNINANYIKQFRDCINNYNIAFYSYDKRTSNLKNVKFFKNIVFEDFVSDVKKVISHFKENTQFSEIILVGHSQGSLVALLAVENVDKYISLAGISNTFDTFVINEYNKVNSEYGINVKKQFKELKKTGRIQEIDPLIAHLVSKPNQPFILSWMKYNPIEEIKKLTIPILVINGTSDLQVSIENAQALKAENQLAKIVLIDSMNHVLKIVKNPMENQQSYFSENFPLSTKLIASIVTFIKE
jgi:pimeloyl-ACP methyl ester carboxylesterase